MSQKQWAKMAKWINILDKRLTNKGPSSYLVTAIRTPRFIEHKSKSNSSNRN